MSAPTIGEATHELRLGVRSVSISTPVVAEVVGEQDLSTVETLTRRFAELIAHNDSDLVVDLSGVTFMDVSMVTLLLRTHAYLTELSRHLVISSPSVSARWVLGLCDAVSPLGLHIVEHEGPDAFGAT